MNKVCCICFLVVLLANGRASAQSDTVKHKIAIFAPIYIDSAFDSDTTYRYPKNVFPKFINPGLEFYEGVQIALDSFSHKNAPLEVYVYDTRSATTTLDQQLNSPELAQVELIIAYCTSADVRFFADAALKKNIPVINVNLPTDAGIGGNPYFVMLNPTLRTQCEGIYKHLQRNYALNNIVVFRKKGAMEDRIKTYLDDYGKNTVGVSLKFRYVDLTDSFTTVQLKPYLDTVNTTVCIAGSLDENFGRRLTSQLAALKKMKYQSMVMGMPTWDNIKDFTRPEFKGIEIVYSTPFYNARTDKTSLQIIDFFNNSMFARPSDMVFRGFETMWRFGNILLQYKSDIASNLTNKAYNVFREFDIQPVINKQTMMLDYFENKKLYFLKWQDGLIKSVN